MPITNAQAITFSNNTIRPIADRMAQLYALCVVALNYWNPNGGTGLANATTAATGVAATGGSFAAGTFSWKYTWLNARGETLASAALSLAVTLNQKVTLTIPALPAGATSANIYRGVAGSEGLVGNTATTSFVDTGATAPGVVVPTSNTSGLIPNDSEILMDTASTPPPGDGRPPLTGIQCVNMVNRMTDIKNLMEGSVAVAANDGTKAILNTVMAVAVNPNA